MHVGADEKAVLTGPFAILDRLPDDQHRVAIEEVMCAMSAIDDAMISRARAGDTEAVRKIVRVNDEVLLVLRAWEMSVAMATSPTWTTQAVEADRREANVEPEGGITLEDFRALPLR